MNPTERMLVHLLDCTLNAKVPEEAFADGVDWTAMFQLAQEHKIDALLLDAICMLPEASQPAPDVLAAWQENAMLTMMGQALLTDQLHRLLAALEAKGLRPVVFKGVALKALYPQPDLRTMSDADLLVGREGIDAARALAEAEGYRLTDEEPGVYIYTGPDGLRVELHAYLFDKAAYSFLSRLDEEAMFSMALAERVPVYGGEAWVFPPKEHALYMLCHMAKHMITTGFGLRQTADFVLFVRANGRAIDWPAFWAAAEQLGLRAFASALLSLGVRYLSLQQGEWAAGALESADAADTLLLDLLDAGVFGSRTEERVSSAAVVYRGVADTKDSDKGRIRRAVFPSATSLKAPYLYAREHPALLPAAWVHRWINYGRDMITGKRRYADDKAGLQVADERLRLLDQLGLRDDP